MDGANLLERASKIRETASELNEASVRYARAKALAMRAIAYALLWLLIVMIVPALFGAIQLARMWAP